VGSVNQSGSVQVSPTTSTVYTGNFVGQNGQNITCQASLNVQGYVYPVYPTNTTPYITLSAVPYTGLDLGPIGDVAYWSLLALMGLLGVYLVGVRKLHRDVAGWMQGKRKARLSF